VSKNPGVSTTTNLLPSKIRSLALHFVVIDFAALRALNGFPPKIVFPNELLPINSES
jgi:hypothetical protein